MSVNVETTEIIAKNDIYLLKVNRNNKESKLDWHWELFAPGEEAPFITGNTNNKNYIKKQAGERSDLHRRSNS